MLELCRTRFPLPVVTSLPYPSLRVLITPSLLSNLIDGSLGHFALRVSHRMGVLAFILFGTIPKTCR